jgi:hypothetical protein
MIMSFAETMRIWSNVNCGLASAVTYLDQRTNGVPTGYAGLNLFGNLANGVARNEAAYHMQRFGNPAGNLVNMYSGYGNPVSNAVGTLGLMNACMFNPWMFFNSYSYMCPPMPMACGGYFGGMGMGFNPMMSMGCYRGFWC